MHRIIRSQPADVHVDIEAYLSRVSSTFRKFVLDTLVKLGYSLTTNLNYLCLIINRFHG